MPQPPSAIRVGFISFAVPYSVPKTRAQGVEEGSIFFCCDWTGQEILVKQNLSNLLKGIVAGRGRLSARVVSSCVISHAFTT